MQGVASYDVDRVGLNDAGPHVAHPLAGTTKLELPVSTYGNVR